MQHSPLRQYEIANDILTTICSIGNVSFLQLCSYQKSEKLNILRGLYYYCARENGVGPARAARLICRTRSNVINQARKYWHYIQVKDKDIMNLYNLINEKKDENRKQ